MANIEIQMTHIATRTPDGLIHVQNYVQGLRGQHHIHTEESFGRWNRHHETKVEVDDGECSCGLGKAGMVRSYDGHISFNDRFLKEIEE